MFEQPDLSSAVRSLYKQTKMSTTNFSSKRLISLDALRGFTIIAMIVVNDPGFWSHVYAPLRHAEWNGVTPTIRQRAFRCGYSCQIGFAALCTALCWGGFSTGVLALQEEDFCEIVGDGRGGLLNYGVRRRVRLPALRLPYFTQKGDERAATLG